MVFFAFVSSSVVFRLWKETTKRCGEKWRETPLKRWSHWFTRLNSQSDSSLLLTALVANSTRSVSCKGPQVPLYFKSQKAVECIIMNLWRTHECDQRAWNISPHPPVPSEGKTWSSSLHDSRVNVFATNMMMMMMMMINKAIRIVCYAWINIVARLSLFRSLGCSDTSF